MRPDDGAVRASETSVNIYLTTQQYIPEDSKVYTFFVAPQKVSYVGERF
jgi:hypothetical protein